MCVCNVCAVLLTCLCVYRRQKSVLGVLLYTPTVLSEAGSFKKLVGYCFGQIGWPLKLLGLLSPSTHKSLRSCATMPNFLFVCSCNVRN